MGGLRFYIDKISNSIEDAVNGKSHDTEAIPVTRTDLERVLKKNGWWFNWKAELKQADRQVYKLVIKEHKIIQGLISIQPVNGFIEMHLIESAPHNRGKSKQFVGVPANLIAFACKKSFDSGFEGFVGFSAKTQLIRHYIDSLGAELVFKNRMRICGNSSKKLVNSYYKNYFNDE